MWFIFLLPARSLILFRLTYVNQRFYSNNHLLFWFLRLHILAVYAKLIHKKDWPGNSKDTIIFHVSVCCFAKTHIELNHKPTVMYFTSFLQHNLLKCQNTDVKVTHRGLKYVRFISASYSNVQMLLNVSVISQKHQYWRSVCCPQLAAELYSSWSNKPFSKLRKRLLCIYTQQHSSSNFIHTRSVRIWC